MKGLKLKINCTAERKRRINFVKHREFLQICAAQIADLFARPVWKKKNPELNKMDFPFKACPEIEIYTYCHEQNWLNKNTPKR